MELRSMALPALLLTVIASVPGADSTSVLVVSLGGIRFDSMKDLVSLQRVAKNGARALQVKSVFPTEHLPAALSLATGVYPEVHGIVANRMVDNGDVFEQGVTKDTWWKGVQPLWVTARRSGIESAVFGFPGADVRGFEADLLLNDSSAMSLEDRVEKALGFLEQSEGSKSRFVLLSLDTSSQAGQESHVSVMDKQLGSLFKQLQERELEQSVDVIVAGTHGLLRRSNKQKQLCLDKMIDASKYELVDHSSGMAAIQPADSHEGSLFKNLTSSLSGKSGAQVYLHHDVPKALHYSHNPRIADIIVLADPSHYICKTCSKQCAQERSGSGYSSDVSDMHTLFVAVGPSFKRDSSIEAISLTDIYPLVCDLLGVKPMAHNGSLQATADLLVQSSVLKKEDKSAPKQVDTSEKANKRPTVPGASLSAGGVFLILLGSVVFAGSLFALREYMRKQSTAKGGYRLMERNFEPDLSLQTEPLLGDDSLSYRCPESIQLSIMGESGRGLSLYEEEDDDDCPPGTFTV